MHNDVTVAILSAIEPPLPECVKAVEAQLGGPYRVIRIKDVFPMHRAFNEMIRQSAPSRFVVQVDGDVVLHVGAVETLLQFIREHPLAYMAWGQLYEDGFGMGGAVRIWRRWPLRLFRFRDRRCVDRDLHVRIRWTGLRRLQVKWSDAPDAPFGTHYPRQTPFARYTKSKSDASKWVHLCRQDLLWDRVWAVPRNPVEANLGLFAGLLHTPNRSRDAGKDYREFSAIFGKECK